MFEEILLTIDHLGNGLSDLDRAMHAVVYTIIRGQANLKLIQQQDEQLKSVGTLLDDIWRTLLNRFGHQNSGSTEYSFIEGIIKCLHSNDILTAMYALLYMEKVCLTLIKSSANVRFRLDICCTFCGKL